MSARRYQWQLNQSSGGAVMGKPVFGFAQALPPQVKGFEYQQPDERIAWVGSGLHVEWENHRPDVEIICARQRP